MPDEMDHMQERCLRDLDINIQAVTRLVRVSSVVAECFDCGDAISELRQSLGARYCMPCQREIEAVQTRRVKPSIPRDKD